MSRRAEPVSDASFGLRLLHIVLYTFIEISTGYVPRPSHHPAHPHVASGGPAYLRPRACHPLSLRPRACHPSPRSIVVLLNTPAAIDKWVSREAAAQFRLDPVVTYFMHQIGMFHIFLGVSAHLMRNCVLEDVKVARPFYTSLIVVHLSLFCLARSSEQAGVTTDGTTLEAGAVAAVFGGGAALALRFGPAPAPFVDDDDDDGPPGRDGPSAATSSSRAGEGKKDK